MRCSGVLSRHMLSLTCQLYANWWSYVLRSHEPKWLLQSCKLLMKWKLPRCRTSLPNLKSDFGPWMSFSTKTTTAMLIFSGCLHIHRTRKMIHSKRNKKMLRGFSALCMFNNAVITLHILCQCSLSQLV
jgi:hypothetical protein